MRSKIFLIHASLLIALAAAVFGNTLFHGFVWDDLVYSAGNSIYRDFNLREMVLSCGNGFEYRPVRDITRAIDFAVWGEMSGGHHFTNLALYGANLLALYLMIFLVVRSHRDSRNNDEMHWQKIAFLTTVLFAVHPLHSETVSFLGSRSALLAGLFTFICCGMFLQYLETQGSRRRLFFGGALLSFIAALLSYPAAISLSLILAFFVAVNPKFLTQRNLFALVPFFIGSLVLFLIFRNVGIQGGLIANGADEMTVSLLLAKTAKALDICFFYLGKFVLPAGLSPEYDVVFNETFLSPRVFVQLAAVVLVAAFSLRVRKKYPEILFTVVWFLTAMVPVSNYFATTPAVADRYAYLPTVVCFFLPVALLFRLKESLWKGVAVTATLVAAVLAVFAYRQNAVWKNDRILWQTTAERSPGLVKPYLNLGATYLNEGDYDKALEFFRKMRSLNFDGATKYDCMEGLIHTKKEELPEAAAAYRRAIGKNERYLMALVSLADVNFAMGDYGEAVRNYGMAQLSRDVDPRGLKRIAAVRQEEIRKIIFPGLDQLREKAAKNPGDRIAKAQLAIELDSLGHYAEALTHYLELAQQDAGNWQLHCNIANIYKKCENWDAAAFHYQKSLAINPYNHDALNNLGLVYRDLKKYPLAVAAFKKVEAFDGNYALAPFNLAITYYLMGEKENAIRSFQHTLERFPELEPDVRSYLQLVKQ